VTTLLATRSGQGAPLKAGSARLALLRILSPRTRRWGIMQPLWLSVGISTGWRCSSICRASSLFFSSLRLFQLASFYSSFKLTLAIFLFGFTSRRCTLAQHFRVTGINLFVDFNKSSSVFRSGF
jgi:hypothetical protein